ncbi:cadherin-like domain-containing protein [Nitrosomonas communis]|uniref:cadherin-like domain-containing protein n=1 Tax=Nitrosomonas communis TaxID=44574 RepID=UPI0026ED5582|nr:cadherin-like domain-containing protein [Nitrosomonas communis]MCO6427238.1 cadherin-like domain-containing protein [Nitrosomonas communis]
MHVEKRGCMDLRGLTVAFILALLVIFLPLNLTNAARAAEPAAFGSWVKTAKIGGAALFTGMTAQEMEQIISNMVAQKVTVIEADSNLSNYLSDAQFEQELALMRSFATEAHKRGLRVVWYYPGLEVLTPNGKNLEHTMFKDHPDWVQISIDGQPNVFYGGDGRVHWVEKDMESAWMSPESPYKDYFLDRVRKIAATGIDGLWLDVPLFNDIGVKWAGFDPYAIAKFKADTGLDAPVAEDWTDSTWRRWIAWRHQEIALFLRDVASAGRAVNPEFPLIVETVTLDYNAATVIALDGADLKNSEGITHVWEIDALSDGNSMRSSLEDDWISLIAMNKFGRAASGKKPSWVFTYGQLSDDAELVMAEALATRNNPYETKIPQMTTSVGADYRTRMFGWIQENSPYLFEAQPGARVAVLYSSPSRDYVDQAAGVGLYTDTTSNDPLWWSTTPIDSAYERQYLAEYRGMVKMLVHQHIPFESVVNPVDSAELMPYETVILPAVQAISDTEAAILRQYVQNGGNLIITGTNPTGLDEYGTARADYALADLLGFSKRDPLPAEKHNTFGAGNVLFSSVSLGKNYFVSSDATALQKLSGAVQATSTIPLTTDADRRVHFELSQLGNQTILQFVNFIGVDGSFTVEPTNFTVSLKIPDGKQVTGVALTSPDLPNTPALSPLNYTTANQQISFDVALNQYALVVIFYDGAQPPSNNHTPIASKDNFNTGINVPVNFTHAMLLANDGDLDGDTLVVTAVNAANASGSLVNQDDGSFTYTPGQDFVGTDTLTYAISDGKGGTDPGIINIHVTPPVTVYHPTSVTVTTGTFDFGTMASFKSVDNDTYDILSAAVAGGQGIDWHVTTTLAESPATVAQIKVTHIGQYGQTGVTQNFYVYNFRDQAWELINTSTVSNESDLSVSKIIDTEVSKYISPQGELQVRLTGFKAGNNSLQSWSNALSWEVLQATGDGAARGALNSINSPAAS